MATTDPKLLKSLPIEVLRSLPAAQPPQGVQANFDNPPTRVPVILGVGITFLVIACICYFIRIYTKLFIVKKWKWDDLTISLGFVCSIIYFTFIVRGSVLGPTGKHEWDVHLDKILSKPELEQNYVTVVLVTPALGLIKISLFIQYYLLFKIVRYVRISVYIGATLSAIFYIAVTISGFVLNSPWHGEDLIDTMLSWHYMKFSEFSIPTGVIGMVVDWTLFIIPIPAVWTLHLSLARKIGVMLVFLTGGLAAIASILSLYYRVQLQRDTSDATWKVSYVLLWSTIEMFAGITASSMPTVRQFFARHEFFNSLGISIRSYLGSNFGQFRSSRTRSTMEKLPDADSGSGYSGNKDDFKQWGYKSQKTVEGSVDVTVTPKSESTEGLGLNHIPAGGIQRTQDVHVSTTKQPWDDMSFCSLDAGRQV